MITISERREHESAKSFVLRVLIDKVLIRGTFLEGLTLAIRRLRSA